MIRAVSLDVGETVVNETREYGAWADWLDVPRHTFSAVFGAVIACGGDYRETFQIFRPGFNLDEERQKRADAGEGEAFGEEDLYPDARPGMEAMSLSDVKVGLAGNQTATAEGILRGLDLPVDSIGTSASWGVEKPSPAFFERVVEEMGYAPAETLYVGDRLDNDILPAQEAGLQTAFIRRGPWGHILDTPAASRCLFRVANLTELATLVEQHNQAA